jgi:hypothetical protein
MDNEKPKELKELKFCFLLQRRFAYVGHNLAMILKEKYGVTKFCGYVYTRESFEFLKKQTDISYTSLLLDDEIHKSYKNERIDWRFLNKLEKEYGIPNLWPFIFVDRVVMHNLLVREYPYDKSPYTSDEIIKIFQVKAKAIINFLEKEKPDVIYFPIVGSIGNTLLYYLAKRKKIKTLFGIETRIGRGCILSEDYKSFSYAENLFDYLMANNQNSKKIDAAKKYLDSWHKTQSPYLCHSPYDQDKDFRLRPLKWLTPKNLIRSFSWFAKLFYSYLKGRQNDYCDVKPLGAVIDKSRRKLRTLIGFSRLYDKVDLTEDFAFYPLHYEPEAATMLMAPFWTDQINLVTQIAKSLPLRFKLYIKEHPAMVGYRTRGYYKKLKKIPNVKLIDADFPSFDLVQKTKLVITITGTVGWEAILSKKPVITFGYVNYNKLSTVKKCENIEQLPCLVKEQLENFQSDEKELLNFIGAIMEESVEAGLGEIWERRVEPAEEKVRLAMLVDLMAKKLNLAQSKIIN